MLLSDELVDPSVCPNFPMRLVSPKGNVEVMKLLMGDHRVDPSAKGNYTVLRACQNSQKNGYIQVVKVLPTGKRVDASASAR